MSLTPEDIADLRESGPQVITASAWRELCDMALQAARLAATNESGLLPCPFCGGEAKPWWSFGAVYVECRSCGAEQANSSGLSDEIEARAIAKWNRRAARPGYVAVPREPTMGQWDDFCAVFPVPFDKFMAGYKAILAAAAEGKK